MKNIRKFLLNALLLCAVSLLMRTVGVSFNVYVSNKAGAEAMGLYALLSGVYGFALTFATSGIGITTIRMISGALGSGDFKRMRRSLKKCLLYSILFSSVASVALFFGAEFIGCRLLSDPRTVLSLRLLSLTLVPISVTSVFNGYFTATRYAWKNAAIQVAEQAVRIFLISFLLSFLLPLGTEFACAALALGGTLSECFSFLASLFAFFLDRTRKKNGMPTVSKSQTVTSELLGTALPIAFSAYARSGLISIEHMLIPIGLCKYGSTRKNSLASYGKLQSMVFPIVLFPSALIQSFSGLLIPELTECCAKNNRRQIRYICERVMQLSLLFSIGVSGIMLCFSSDLGNAIYPDQGTAIYIKLLAPLIPIMYMDTTVDSMLKGLGDQFYCMMVNILDALLSVILVWILLPKMGIMGYVVTIYAAELINATLSITRLLSKSRMKPRLIKWIGKPLLCIIGATCLTRILFPQKAFLSIYQSIYLTFLIISTALFYIILLVATASFSLEDITWVKSILARDPMTEAKKESPKRLSSKINRSAGLR